MRAAPRASTCASPESARRASSAMGAGKTARGRARRTPTRSSSRTSTTRRCISRRGRPGYTSSRATGTCRLASALLLDVILPKDRDRRFVTIRRGGTLTDPDHQLLAMWAASCAEHVLHLFLSAQPEDPRPRQAIEQIRAWVRREITMTQARNAAGHANAAARDLSG